MFKPGQSGNPGGRPKIPEEIKAKIYDGAADAVDFWLETLHNPDAPIQYRDKAAERLAAYGYGKPRESVDLSVEGTMETVQLTYDEKRARLKHLLSLGSVSAD